MNPKKGSNGAIGTCVTSASILNAPSEEGPTQFGDATWAVCDLVDLDSSQLVRDDAVFGTVLAGVRRGN